MRALILTHAELEGPGRIATALERRGISWEIRGLHAGAAVPSRLQEDVLVVLMGGPMGVADADRFPFLAAEHDLVVQQLAAGRPMLGICLGAQIIAQAAGATVVPLARPPVWRRPSRSRAPERTRPERRQRWVGELGWHPITCAPALQRLVPTGPARLDVLHWHCDTFSLPPGAQTLASSQRCRQQGFRLGRAIGLQFHPEVDAAIVRSWVDSDAAMIERICGPRAACRLRAASERRFAADPAPWDALLDAVLGACLDDVPAEPVSGQGPDSFPKPAPDTP